MSDKEKRIKFVENAIHSLYLEDFDTQGFKELTKPYIDGEITAEEFFKKMVKNATKRYL